MKKKMKRALALLLSCTIIIGSFNNARFKAHASAAGIIAGGGAATVGVEVAFPYLLAITGVVAAGAAVYENRDKIKEWGTAQFGKFKKWVGDNLDALGWAADAAVAGTAIAAWGDKLGKGTLDKSDPTWSAYKKWVEDDVCTSDSEDAEYNGYPAFGFNTAMPIWDSSISGSGDYIGYMYQSGSKKPTVGYMSKSSDTVITYGDGLRVNLDTSFA